MHAISCFAPIAARDARLLILGSMPGVESLRQQQYYAHPRNSFWYIMSGLLNLAPGLPYEERKAALLANRIALWDVLNTCVRKGSLDTSIDKPSIVTNDFLLFFNEHPEIAHVFFNGRTAEREYMLRVFPALQSRFSHLRYHLLPSTSPAMASLNRDQKREAWRRILGSVL